MESAISDTTSFDAMLKALQRLKRLRKLEGTIVIKEGECLSSETLLGERQVSDFVIQIKALLAQYRNSGSVLSRALFNFSGGSFIVFSLSPYVFCLFFGESDDAAAVEKAGEEFLEEWRDSLNIEETEIVSLPGLQIEVEPSEDITESAEESSQSSASEQSVSANALPVSFDRLDIPARDECFKEEVKSLFEGVLGMAQVNRLLDSEWKTFKAIPYDSRKDPPEKAFGKSLISQVRDRRIRKQLGHAHDDLVVRYYGLKRGGIGA